MELSVPSGGSLVTGSVRPGQPAGGRWEEPVLRVSSLWFWAVVAGSPRGPGLRVTYRSLFGLNVYARYLPRSFIHRVFIGRLPWAGRGAGAGETLSKTGPTLEAASGGGARR